MSNQLTFAKLKNLLIHLGFTEEIITHQDKQAVVFKNSATEVLIILPRLSPRTLVRQAHLLAVKRILIENNLLDREQFSKLVNA
jgi:hypothetical protein